MVLTHLSLTNFRNFSRLDMDVPPGTVLLVGSNAQGKTSLLEAVYMLATSSSFHAENDRQLIHFNILAEEIAVARIVGRFQRNGGSHTLELRIIQEREGFSGQKVRKEVLYDGVKQKLSEAVGHFNAVLFLPQMSPNMALPGSRGSLLAACSLSSSGSASFPRRSRSGPCTRSSQSRSTAISSSWESISGWS